MIALLAEHAPLTPVPLCPEIRAHYARSLIGVWDAAEQLAGSSLPAPFWAYPWAAGQALARVILDEPARVHGRRVLDFGAGGGVASLACALAGADAVVANDIDPWALAVTRLAARRQGLHIDTLEGDLTVGAPPPAADVVLCSDLSYDRRSTPRERAFLDRARARGASLLIADAGRTYFDPSDLTLIASREVRVPLDLEGAEVRIARVYQTTG